MPISKNPPCPVCGKEFNSGPKKSFLSGASTYQCGECGYAGSTPIKTSFQILYFTITIILINIIVTGGFIGVIGFIVPVMLIDDLSTRKKILALKKKRGISIEPIPPISERSEINKGILYSAIAMVVTYFLSKLT